MSNTFSFAGINGREIRKTVFQTADGKKVLTPKAVTYTATINKVDLTLTYKVGTKLRTIRNKLDGTACYDPTESANHILSEEEVADREDPNRTSDAFLFCEPELDTDAVLPLDMEDKLDRYAWFVAVCNRIAEPDMLEYILENAPKKKNGTLAQRKLTLVAELPVVFSSQMAYFEVVGKPQTEHSMELSILERKFSGEALSRTTENEFLQYMASGKKAAVPKKEFVKLIVEAYQKKTAIEVPAIRMDNGQLAIAAKPYRPLSDYKCLTGNDKQGYEIILPKDIEPCQINHGKVPIFVESLLEVDHLGLKAGWSSLSDTVQYIRTRNKKFLMYAEVELTGGTGKEIPKRSLTENFIAEYMYQLLHAVEELNEKISDPGFAQYVVDHAKYKKDGTLNQSSMISLKISTSPVIGREIPLVYIRIDCINRANDHLKIQYGVRSNTDDTWSEYRES